MQMERVDQSDFDTGVDDGNSMATPVTLDYASGEEYVVRTHFTQAVLATLLIFPVGLIALFCSAMAAFNLSDGKYAKAHRWGKRSGFIGMLGLILFALGTLTLLII
jgi:phosphatidylglycerophosphate synthase